MIGSAFAFAGANVCGVTRGKCEKDETGDLKPEGVENRSREAVGQER